MKRMGKKKYGRVRVVVLSRPGVLEQRRGKNELLPRSWLIGAFYLFCSSPHSHLPPGGAVSYVFFNIASPTPSQYLVLAGSQQIQVLEKVFLNSFW